MDLLNYLKTIDPPRMPTDCTPLFRRIPNRRLVPGGFFALRNIHDSREADSRTA